MKEYTLKKDSWHYKLATYGSPENRMKLKYEPDLCEYIRMVIVSAFLWTFLYSVGTAFVVSILFSWYDLAMFVFFGKEFLEKFSIVMYAGQAGIFIFLAMVGIAVYFRNYREKRDRTSEPGFMTLAYRKFKDKTCSRINFE